jgi:hypothetical protein
LALQVEFCSSKLRQNLTLRSIARGTFVYFWRGHVHVTRAFDLAHRKWFAVFLADLTSIIRGLPWTCNSTDQFYADNTLAKGGLRSSNFVTTRKIRKGFACANTAGLMSKWRTFAEECVWKHPPDLDLDDANRNGEPVWALGGRLASGCGPRAFTRTRKPSSLASSKQRQIHNPVAHSQVRARLPWLWPVIRQVQPTLVSPVRSNVHWASLEP